MPKIPEKTLQWRREQKPGAIMKPATFEKIVQKCLADHKGEKGWDRPRCERVAGKAYWQTVKSKAKERAKEVRKQLT